MKVSNILASNRAVSVTASTWRYRNDSAIQIDSTIAIIVIAIVGKELDNVESCILSEVTDCQVVNYCFVTSAVINVPCFSCSSPANLNLCAICVVRSSRTVRSTVGTVGRIMWWMVMA